MTIRYVSIIEGYASKIKGYNYKKNIISCRGLCAVIFSVGASLHWIEVLGVPAVTDRIHAADAGTPGLTEL